MIFIGTNCKVKGEKSKVYCVISHWTGFSYWCFSSSSSSCNASAEEDSYIDDERHGQIFFSLMMKNGHLCVINEWRLDYYKTMRKNYFSN